MLGRREQPARPPRDRAGGILLHPTSLPGVGGMGDLGPAALRFVEWLAAAGQRLWQVLPLGPTSGSPYSSWSSVAGNPLLVSPEALADDGLLAPGDWPAAGAPNERVDFRQAASLRLPLLREAFARFRADPRWREPFLAFRREHATWLDDYALFMALRDDRRTWWLEWPRELVRRKPAALAAARESLAEGVDFHAFTQFMFWRQWQRLREHAREHGITLVGDLSYYVALDSADVWAHPAGFSLSRRTRRPRFVGGVPPDMFTPKGQLWGMPVYRWRRMRHDGFRWWMRRFRVLAELVDIVRIDHFRGFEAFWRVPAHHEDAVRGKWVKAPGKALFRQLRRECPSLAIWAEDLGHITPEVDALRERFGFACMRVLQFAFDGGPGNGHLPFHHPVDCVVYTGTHDNDTTAGWWASLAEEQQARIASYFDGFDPDEVHWHLARMAMGSVARWCILPLQDVLGLGSEARMNTPGTAHGNWAWRLPPQALTEDLAARLRALAERYGRSG